MRGRLRAAAVALTLVGAIGSVGVAAAQPASAVTCSLEWRYSSVQGYYAGYYSGNSTNTKRGQTNDRVKEVQCLLIIWADHMDDQRLNPHGADGQFGANTEAAVRAAQRYYLFKGQSSEWDGEVGPKTWPRLRALSRPDLW